MKNTSLVKSFKVVISGAFMAFSRCSLVHDTVLSGLTGQTVFLKIQGYVMHKVETGKQDAGGVTRGGNNLVSEELYQKLDLLCAR
jgi:hypothetical protein